jgi:tRNA U38,U39,U40 pseudouridine synthase TruA
VGKHDFVNFVHKDERKAAVKSENVDEDAKCSSVTNDADAHGGVDETERRKSHPPPHEIDLIEFNVVESGEGEDEEEEDRCILPPVVNATFTLSAKGFHRCMVRNLVGFAVDVARGVRNLEDIATLLLKTSRDNDSTSDSLANNIGIVNAAPACGLSLATVKYEHDDFL